MFVPQSGLIENDQHRHIGRQSPEMGDCSNNTGLAHGNMAQKDDMLVAARPVSRDVAPPMTDFTATEADALAPTPTECALPRRFSDFATVGEALDYAAQGTKGLNFHDARGTLLRAYTYAELRRDALDCAARFVALGLRKGDRGQAEPEGKR